MKTIRFTLLISVSILLCCFKKTDHAYFILQTENAILQGPCAVFVAPTPDQIDTLKVKLGANNFYTSADDNMFNIAKSRTFLEGKKVPIVNKDAIGSVKFKKADGKIVEQQLSGMNWGVILFNGKSDPMVADMKNIEKDYNKYMK
jgi:hypothetical protein